MRVHLHVALSTLLLTAAAQGAGYSGVVVAGDSLSDCGNVFAASGGTFPYPSGRFCNGPVWAEYLAASLGTNLQPSALGGGDNAWGGAETGMGTTLLLGVLPVPGVRQQVHDYVTLAGILDPNKLYIIWGGANDLFNGQIDPTIPATNITSAVSELASAGAKRILVNNLPNFGLTPAFLGTPYETPMAQLSQGFDTALGAGLAALPGALVLTNDADKLAHPGWDTNPGLTIFYFQIDQMFDDMITHPAKYNLTNVTQPVFDSNTSSVVGDPAAYMFWDTVHPTTAAQAFLGAAAGSLVTVPEPAALSLLLLGTLGLLCRGRTR